MTVEASETSGVRIFPPAIPLAGLAVGFLMQWVWPLALAGEEWARPVRLVGYALVALWLLLAVWAVVIFRRAGTSPLPTRPTTALALGGPYRFTRNPMYVGLAFLQAGVALAANAVWPLALLPLVLWVIWREVIRLEEKYLEAKYGGAYLMYKRQVRRWL